jgi:hypothetical protein
VNTWLSTVDLKPAARQQQYQDELKNVSFRQACMTVLAGASIFGCRPESVRGGRGEFDIFYQTQWRTADCGGPWLMFVVQRRLSIDVCCKPRSRNMVRRHREHHVMHDLILSGSIPNAFSCVILVFV